MAAQNELKAGSNIAENLSTAILLMSSRAKLTKENKNETNIVVRSAKKPLTILTMLKAYCARQLAPWYPRNHYTKQNTKATHIVYGEQTLMQYLTFLHLGKKWIKPHVTHLIAKLQKVPEYFLTTVLQP